MFKVNNSNNRTRCEIRLSLPERCQWRSGAYVVNFEHFTPCFYCYLWATLNRLGSIDFKFSRFSWHLGCLCAILCRYPYWMTNLHTENKLARYLHTVNKMELTRWSSLSIKPTLKWWGRLFWLRGFDQCINKSSSERCYYVRAEQTDLFYANAKVLIQSGRI